MPGNIRLLTIQGNTQKLDGGAMFGHVPKALWSQWLQPDEKNRIHLACRALLVQDAGRNILLETGIGAFFDPALKERYGVVESRHVLLESLSAAGLAMDDIDAVIISHLHFDHAGGLLSAWEPGRDPALLFPKARYLIGKTAWERACQPHVRDRASFIPQLQTLLAASGRLDLIDTEKSGWLGENYSFRYSHGHTPGLMHTVIRTEQYGLVIFASDLIPGTPWVHLPVGMGYDRLAELLIDEKQAMLDYALKHQAYLYYTHDPVVAMSHVSQDAKGKYSSVSELTFLS
ncbi:putative quorum-quenching lactonase YtnP [Aquicella siphonis]|uniref:Putative quorum-quenching lactonase YtnP n=1 Tax=Aquicella siphonis TaxID=254247 RepID=A0A5E4PJI7_9COXI|nr:MBL fold metallo-hydrolase [Aquicella siphonis]VVC76511.1 putative quorum-quenching lactonase YtnP [Aquicella siphonis]